MKQTDIPIWERYTLTIKNANWLIMNGNRIQIKRKQFEKIIDTLDAI